MSAHARAEEAAPVDTVDAIVTLLKSICETPAPTFEEGARGRLVAGILEEAGLEPMTDSVGNVTAPLPGGRGPRVLVAAHLDTVFPADTDVTVREEGDRLLAPGIGDNSASLAVLLHYVNQVQAKAQPYERPCLTVAATVGEEGLGDLYGVRELMKRAADFDLFVALDGHLGTIVDAGVGSRRWRILFSAKGGHSWGDYGAPSAVHALGEAIHALNAMSVPSEPRSSYNVGQVWGGTSINAIAQKAGFNLDLRSLERDTLKRLEEDALTRVRRAAKRANVEVETELVGSRPAARVSNEPLVRAAQEALHEVGVSAHRTASSTDANAAMAAGLPAISFGVYRGGDAHRLSEWLEPASLETGYRAFVTLMANLSRLKV